MRGLKTLVSTTALLVGLALAPAAQAQISISIGVPPVCSYGYYGYAPYACAPMGYYGSGYFYNGIFLGMGPWAGWGYGHGWGGHRFVNDGGGSYHGGAGRVTYRAGSGGAQPSHSAAVHTTAAVSHAGGARPAVVTSHAAAPHASAPHASAPHASAPHASAPRGGGGGGASHGGDARK
ncbi:MAG: hypothetical protein ABSG84_18430 [Acidobacteriaceae bacterium]